MQNSCRTKCSAPAFGREPEIRPREEAQKPLLGRLKNGRFARYCRKFPVCWHGSISSKTSVSCRRNAHFCETDVKQQGVKRVQNRSSKVKILMIRGTRALSAAKQKKAQVEQRQERVYDKMSVSSRRNAHLRRRRNCKNAAFKK